MLAAPREERFEIFMLRRSARSTFLPDVYVFPGGAVDRDDEALASSRLLRADDREDDERRAGGGPAFEVAALREAFEEAGVLLARRADGEPPAPLSAERLAKARRALIAGTVGFAQILEEEKLVLDARRLWYFSRWITPPTENRRFDTRFYLGIVPEDQLASADDFETLDGMWIAPGEALRRHGAGEMPMIFPTLMHLRRLDAFRSLEALAEFADAKTIAPVNPVVTEGTARVFSLPAELEERW